MIAHTKENDEMVGLLPPINNERSIPRSERQFQVKLPVNTFLKLEVEAARRGLTSYKLAQTILMLYLSGQLKPVNNPTNSNAPQNENE